MTTSDTIRAIIARPLRLRRTMALLYRRPGMAAYRQSIPYAQCLKVARLLPVAAKLMPEDEYPQAAGREPQHQAYQYGLREPR